VEVTSSAADFEPTTDNTGRLLPPAEKSKMAVEGGYFDPWTIRVDVIIVSICRLMIIAAIACACIWRRDIDGSVDAAYQALRLSWVFQHETFEVWKVNASAYLEYRTLVRLGVLARSLY